MRSATAAASCPHCSDIFSDLRFCPTDGSPLVTEELGLGPAHQLGQIVAGRYRILDRIGEGGMGSVYRAEHVVMGKMVAMKILHRDLCRHDHAVRRFEREARAASLLEHPNCCSVTDFGVAENGSVFLTMEYLEGKDLFDTLQADRYFSASRTVHVMRQIASGLSEAHHRGVIHRDLKPENIFLVQRRDRSDFVKILDFGIAKVLDEDTRPALTASGTVFGTPEYLSPEQGSGHAIDHRADLYSVGVIMYRMLAGHLPFRGGNKMALIRRQISETPKPFSMLRMPEQVPESLERVCFKLLAKNPDDRYQSAEEIGDALLRVDVRPAAARQREPGVIWIDFSNGNQLDPPPVSDELPALPEAPPDLVTPLPWGARRPFAMAAATATGAIGTILYGMVTLLG